jgi:hypothetical protein
MVTNAEMYLKCMQIEALVSSMVLSGINDNRKLTEAVDKQFHPVTEWEQEMYSEAIIYAKYAILN